LFVSERLREIGKLSFVEFCVIHIIIVVLVLLVC